MAIKPAQSFFGKCEGPTSQYPNGSFKNESIPNESNDGTPVDALIVNNFQGIIEAILKAANIPSNGLLETAINSQVLEALRVLFQDSKENAGDWEAGIQLTEADRNKFWIYNRIAYQLFDNTSLPLTMPSSPAEQPRTFKKTDYAPREEIDGAYIHSTGEGLLQGTLQVFKEKGSQIKISSSSNDGDSSIILNTNGTSSTATDGFVIKFNASNKNAEFYLLNSGKKIAFTISQNGLVDFTINPTLNGDQLTTTSFVNNEIASTKQYADTEIKKITPTGSIFDFAIKKDREGYLLCDNSSYPQSQYPDLYAEIGKTFDKNDGLLMQKITNDQFSAPAGITSYSIGSNNYLAVTDYGANKVFIYNLNNTSTPETTITNGQFINPQGITAYSIGSNNYLAVADANANLDQGDGGVFIYNLNNTSTPETTITNGQFINPRGITSYSIGSNNYLAVTDYGANKVFIYNLGNTSTPETTITNEQFRNPQGITAYPIGSNNYLAVVDSSADTVFIYNLNNTTTPETTIAYGNFREPIDITSYSIGSNNYLAVVDYSASGVFIFNLNNTTNPEATISNDQFSAPAGITSYSIGSNNYLAVTAVGRDKVFIYNLNNTTTPETTIINNQFSSPYGITPYSIGSSNYLAVTDLTAKLGQGDGGVFIFEQLLTPPSYIKT